MAEALARWPRISAPFRKLARPASRRRPVGQRRLGVEVPLAVAANTAEAVTVSLSHGLIPTSPRGQSRSACAECQL